MNGVDHNSILSQLWMSYAIASIFHVISCLKFYDGGKGF